MTKYKTIQYLILICVCMTILSCSTPRDLILEKIARNETFWWSEYGKFSRISASIKQDTLNFHYPVTAVSLDKDSIKFNNRIYSDTKFKTLRISDEWWAIHNLENIDSLVFSGLSVRQSDIKSEKNRKSIVLEFPDDSPLLMAELITDKGSILSKFGHGQLEVVDTLNSTFIKQINLTPFSYHHTDTSGPMPPPMTQLLFSKSVNFPIHQNLTLTFPNATSKNIYKIAIPDSFLRITSKGTIIWGDVTISPDYWHR